MFYELYEELYDVTFMRVVYTRKQHSKSAKQLTSMVRQSYSKCSIQAFVTKEGCEISPGEISEDEAHSQSLPDEFCASFLCPGLLTSSLREKSDRRGWKTSLHIVTMLPKEGRRRVEDARITSRKASKPNQNYLPTRLLLQVGKVESPYNSPWEEVEFAAPSTLQCI